MLYPFSQMFQFTHPGRGATGSLALYSSLGQVSIHAPREGCDFSLSLCTTKVEQFQFTHPGRGATKKILKRSKTKTFQFTHPGRGATGTGDAPQLPLSVSIHAPREGCDTRKSCSSSILNVFQFTHPGRGATRNTLELLNTNLQFQFTHPGRGATSRF